MFDPNDLSIKTITSRQAKEIVKANHYMKTWPQGSSLYFGVMYKHLVKGVMVFGKSSGTDKKVKLFDNRIDKHEIIEMQRMWLCDSLGANAESKALSLVMSMFKKHAPHIKVVWTYAGGCKNDCGIVYQSSGFMYLGCEPCNDFYLTDKGEYKNLISAKRFGRAPKGLTDGEIGKLLFGPGKMIVSKRYYYFYPIDKGIRRIMKKKQKPFPKDSLNWRKDQKWV